MTDLILGNRVLDFGLGALDTDCDRIYVCSSQPTTFAEAVQYFGGSPSGFALGYKVFGAGSAFGSPFTLSPDTDGRYVTSAAVTGGSVIVSGTALYWAAVDSSNARLLATGILTATGSPSGGNVLAGQTFSLDAFTIRVRSASVAYVGPGDIVSGALVWIGMRAYSAASIGVMNAIRIKASDTTESDFGTVSGGGLDTSAISTFLTGHGGSGKIIKFYDQTGNGMHFDTLAVGSGPAYTASGVGGRPTALFDGTSAVQTSSNFAGAPTAQPWSLSYVGNVSGNFSNRAELWYADGNGGSSNKQIVFNRGGVNDNTWEFNAGNILNATAADTTFHTMHALADGASSKNVIDGSVTNGDAGSRVFGTTIERMLVGGDGTTELQTGNFCEWGLWDGDKSGSFSSLNSNQHTFYGF